MNTPLCHPAVRALLALLPLAGLHTAQAAPADVPRPPVLQATDSAASAPKAYDKKVLEDDRVRIEENRVRGQVQSVTVHSKLRGVRDYEVIMPPLGKDPSQDKGAAGKRTWSLFDF